MHKPFSVIVAPPSEIITPPPTADSICIFDIWFVDIVGRPGKVLNFSCLPNISP